MAVENTKVREEDSTSNSSESSQREEEKSNETSQVQEVISSEEKFEKIEESQENDATVQRNKSPHDINKVEVAKPKCSKCFISKKGCSFVYLALTFVFTFFVFYYLHEFFSLDKKLRFEKIGLILIFKISIHGLLALISSYRRVCLIHCTQRS